MDIQQQQIAERLEAIRKKLDDASLERWGRAPEIIAVSKTVEASRVNLVRAYGITRLGENRVQEVLEKMPSLDAGFEIELIGRLQTNKVRQIIDKVVRIQSLDRENLALEIDRRAREKGIRMPVLVQVNIGDEPQKGGIPVDETMAFLRRCAQLPGLKVEGLMAVMPDLEDEALLRPYFRRMRALFETAREEAIDGVQMETLSMGMSGDYVLAAQEGATAVRIGSAIFGHRDYSK